MDDPHHAIIKRVPDPLKDSVAWRETHDREYQRIVCDRFGIADARALVIQAHQRPVTASSKCLVVQTNFITHEAQNALLKVLEEPPLSTSFLFIVPLDLILLPTLQSRFQTEAGAGDTVGVTESATAIFQAFAAQSYKDRLATIEQQLKRKDIIWQRAMKLGLIDQLQRERSLRSPLTVMVAQTLLTRGASNKMLLEALALTLPGSLSVR